nr:TadE family protein [Streptomyces phytophilus]
MTTIEVVILAPVMFLFILVLVAFGQLVDGRGGVDGAARDAVRAASLQRTAGEAQTAAQRAAESQLEGDVCTGPVDVDLSGDFAPPEPGEASSIITVEVTCEVKGLGMLGLDIDPRMTGSSSAPLDPYRRAA